jgi:hypothetical protein
MNRIIISTTLGIAAFTPFAVRAQDLPDNPNRFSFGPTFGINFKADFNNNAVNPGPAAGGANHTYDDGYVLVDSTGDLGGITHYWGYQNASQVVGGAMQFHAIQSGGPSSVTGNPQYGGEFIYQRVIGSLPFLSGDWGLEAGLGFTELDLRENLGGTVPVIMDSFPLGGFPPGAPYNGTFNGPGVSIGDTPTRTATSATLTGYQKLGGQLFSLRLGPFAEWKFTDKFSLAASVGLTLAPTKVDYDFSEVATLAGGGGVIVSSGHSSRSKLLYGPYVGAMLCYDFNKCWGVYVGARFQNLTDLNQSIGGRNARLDPGATLYATAGVTWKF